MRRDLMNIDDLYDIAGEEPVYENLDGSVWILGVDFAGIVFLIRPPNVHEGFYEDWHVGGMGFPEATDDVGPGIYKVTVKFCEGQEPDNWMGPGEYWYEFTPVKWEPLWVTA